MQRLTFLILFLCFFLLNGCIQSEEIEDLGLINARGVDLGENKNLKIQLVVFQFSERTEDFASIISGEGKTITSAIKNATYHSLFPLVPGKLKITLYGRELAEEGILSLLDTDARDARIPDLMYLAISKTTAEEIITVEEEGIGTDIGQYLHGLIERHTTDHNIPRKTLQDFLRIYYDIGQDNAVPFVNMKQGRPNIDAVAVFQDDKLAGEVTMDEAILINLMDRTVNEQLIQITLPMESFKENLIDNRTNQDRDEVILDLLVTKGKSKTKMRDLNTLTFDTKTDIRVRLLEQSVGISLKDPNVIHKMETLISKELEKRFEALLHKLQALNSDPFGYGRYYKMDKEGKELTREQWREKFPKIDVTFHVKTAINNHGVID